MGDRLSHEFTSEGETLGVPIGPGFFGLWDLPDRFKLLADARGMAWRRCSLVLSSPSSGETNPCQEMEL